MSDLCLWLLGPVEASWNGKPLTSFRTKRVEALLLYLAAEHAIGTPHFRREALMALLWPEQPQTSSQGNLRQTLYQLRKAIPELTSTESAQPVRFLLADRHSVRLNPAYPLEVDVAKFDEALSGPQERWHHAVDLYRGDFLADFYLPDADPFESWAGARRAAFRRQVLDALASLTAVHMEQGDLEQAATYARRQLEFDDLRESAHRQLMTALAHLGRRSEALVQYADLEGLLESELGLGPSAETRALAEAIRTGSMRPADASRRMVPQLRVSNPYKGLNAFTEADTDRFFGRELLIDRLVARMAEVEGHHRFLAVVGPSGSGKSSLVRAGLIPALGRGALPGSEKWTAVRVQPGTHPFEELEAALLRVAVNPPTSMLGELLQDERGLLRSAKRALPADEGSGLVLVIDQFEEVFTLVKDLAIREQFLECLYTAVTDPRSPVRVIATLRADFYDRPLRHPNFSQLMRERTEVVVPMTSDELALAIRRPAEAVGVNVEPGLVETIVPDVVKQPGALPLLQYALTELFERRDENSLTIATYHKVGGVAGALGRRAEDTYAGLDQAGKSFSRQLFLRLISLGDAGEGIRMRVPRSELTAAHADSEQAETVIEAYGRARLLSFDRHPRNRSPTVEIAHEALMEEWPRLREWLEDSREDLRMQHALGRAAEEWLAADRDPSFLMTGSRLSQFQHWAADAALVLTHDEQSFLQASLALQRRQAEERRSQRLARERRRRVTVLGLAAGLVLATGLTAYAFIQSRIAAAQQAIAEHQAEVATSRALAAAAERAFSKNRIAEALGYAMQANRIDDPPLDVQSLLYRVAYAPDRNYLESDISSVRDVALSPDGRQALYGGVPSLLDLDTSASGISLAVADLETRQAIWQIADSAGVESIAFSPSGKTVLSGHWDGSLVLRDAATGDVIRRLEGQSGIILSVTFSPDGLIALSGSSDHSLVIWDVSTGAAVRRLVGHNGRVEDVAISPDGRTALSAGNDGVVLQWDLETGELIRRFEEFDSVVQAVAFHPDGRTALVASGTITSAPESPPPLTLWELETGQLSLQFEPDGLTFAVAFSPDGETVLSGDQGGSLILWDTSTGTIIREIEAHPIDVYGVAISPDGRMGLSGGRRGSVRTWHLSIADLMQWIESNLYFRELDCDDRIKYNIEPLCEEN